jgi:hypothetical protein
MVDIFEFVLGLLATLVIVGLIAIGVAGAIDFWGHLKAEHKTFTCAVNQMDARRLSFTDSVICVPYPTRQDTVTINGVK